MGMGRRQEGEILTSLEAPARRPGVSLGLTHPSHPDAHADVRGAGRSSDGSSHGDFRGTRSGVVKKLRPAQPCRGVRHDTSKWRERQTKDVNLEGERERERERERDGMRDAGCFRVMVVPWWGVTKKRKKKRGTELVSG